jgi:hypothetical protein
MVPKTSAVRQGRRGVAEAKQDNFADGDEGQRVFDGAKAAIFVF